MEPTPHPSIDAFIKANEHFTAIAKTISDDQWDIQAKATPEWSVRDLVEHVITNNRATVASLGSDMPAADTDPNENSLTALIQSEQAAEHAALEQTDPARLIQNQYGDQMNVDDLMRMGVTDRTLHAWDLAVSIGADATIDPEAAQMAYDFASPNIEAMRDIKVFGPTVPVSNEAPIQDRVLGLTGRDPLLARSHEQSDSIRS